MEDFYLKIIVCKSFSDHLIVFRQNYLLHGMNSKRLQMVYGLRAAHQGFFMFCCLVNDFRKCFLFDSLHLDEIVQKFLQNSLTINTIDQQIVKFISNPFDLCWILFLEDKLHDFFDLFFVRR
jgi:hypothetical protein